MGGAPKYPKVLTAREVLRLLADGVYQVDSATALVLGYRRNRPLTPFIGNDEGHLFIRLYARNKRKTLAVHRLVWMAVTGAPIPFGFQIHHLDRDVTNNAWSNLLCLHEFDHRKFHGTDDIPF